MSRHRIEDLRISRGRLLCFLCLMLDLILGGGKARYLCSGHAAVPSVEVVVRGFGVVREDPSTKVPSKVWTLQAFNEGPLPGAEGGGGAEGRRASTFRGTEIRRYLRRFAPSKIASNIKVPSKVPTL